MTNPPPCETLARAKKKGSRLIIPSPPPPPYRALLTPIKLRLDTPVNSSTTTHADFSIFSAQRDLNFYASCNEATKGAMARLRVSLARPMLPGSFSSSPKQREQDRSSILSGSVSLTRLGHLKCRLSRRLECTRSRMKLYCEKSEASHRWHPCRESALSRSHVLTSCRYRVASIRFECGLPSSLAHSSGGCG